MARRQRRWARESLDRLRQALGCKCNKCGSAEHLEFDCIKPQGHHHHSQGLGFRATFYWRQARAANLQILCRGCHALKTLGDNAKGLLDDDSTSDNIPY